MTGVPYRSRRVPAGRDLEDIPDEAELAELHADTERRIRERATTPRDLDVAVEAHHEEHHHDNA